MGFHQLVRSDAAGLELGDVLRATPSVLLGVGGGATEALGRLGIASVFDLARSSVFRTAEQIVAAAGDAESPESRLGELPGDVFAPGVTVALADAPGSSADDLRAIAAVDVGGGIPESLDVRTVRDLALWPPYQAARSILDEALGTGPTTDGETPGDLLPVSGRYPTERAYYSTYVLADIDDPAEGERSPLEDAGALDPLTAVRSTGFTRPIRGARLTFVQSWYSQAVALGQLLHSLALAPGESTRVAMIDWSRQQMGTQQDQGGQTEQLAGDMTRKRAMSEVQNAVASEAQQGFSKTSTQSQQLQGGGSGGLSIGPLTLGGSVSSANAQATSATVSGTSGVRNITAAMSQKVADSTHQAASSARTMFASVVRELSQAEHENLSTRVVANYNHMHALTVQYYEVVQVHRTTVALQRFEPCLFVPMKLVDFTGSLPDGTSVGDVVVRRYRAALQAAALDAQTRALLQPAALGLVRIIPSGQAFQTVLRGFTQDASGKLVPVAGRDLLPGVVAQPISPAQATQLAGQLDTLRRTIGRDVVTRVGNALEVPGDLVLQGVAASFSCAQLRLTYADGSAPTVLNAPAQPPAIGDPFQVAIESVPLRTVAQLDLDTGGNIAVGVVTLTVSYQGVSLQVPLPVALGSDTGLQSAVTFQHQITMRDLLQRLQDDQLYYSQIVWQAMDSATVALLLAPFTYLDAPLAQAVDLAPVGVTGNYLIFDMPWSARDLPDPDAPADTVPASLGGVLKDTAWTDWVRRHADFETTKEDFVPLPSGGVFAEAVLGRANSAEKLDITRFWNWQDSPIPLQAPDIAALQAGSRAQPDNTTPSSLAAPVVAFNNPPALPDPAGLSGALSALANGAMFRDMSGSSTAQALALAALSGAGQGATSAGQQAAAAAAAAAAKEVEMAKIAAGVVTGGAAGGGANGTVSEQGAKINEGRSMDERAVPAASGDGTGAPTAGSHEAEAAEGPTGRALNLLGSALRGGTGPADAESSPPTESGSTSGSTSSSTSGSPPSSPPTAGPDGGA